MDDHSFILGGLLFCSVFKDSLCFPQRATVLLPWRSAFALFFLPVQNQPYGEIATMQARHIATVFHGRMTGSPAEMLSADYLRQQFADMGYQSDIRSFHSRYVYTSRNKTKTGIT